MFAYKIDGSLRSFNIVMKPADLAFLDADPTAEEYVPCALELNYESGGSSSGSVTAAQCRYKGSTGCVRLAVSDCHTLCCVRSFTGCLDKQGALLPRSLSRKCNLSWKIKFGKHAEQHGDTKLLMGASKLQFSGMGGDASLSRDMLGYSLLNGMGYLAPCSAPALIYINGRFRSFVPCSTDGSSVGTREWQRSWRTLTVR
jgi:hypothetical protein